MHVVSSTSPFANALTVLHWRVQETGTVEASPGSCGRMLFEESEKSVDVQKSVSRSQLQSPSASFTVLLQLKVNPPYFAITFAT